MYYAVCLFLYALLLFWLYRMIKAPKSPSLWQRFSNTLAEFGIKGLTKSDVPDRKRRTRVLPRRQRILYWVWFDLHIVMLIGLPVVLMLLNHAIQGILFIPRDALAFSSNEGSMCLFLLGAFFVVIPVVVVYSTITNHGVIREADRHYRMGSFAEYPALINKILSGICLLIGLPVVMLSLHSYTYFTNHEIVFQGAIVSCTVRYDQIKYAQVSVEQHGKDFDIEYYIRYGDGDPFAERAIYENGISWLDVRKIDNLLVQERVDVRRIPIKSELLRRIQEKLSDSRVELAIDLCGVSGQ